MNVLLNSSNYLLTSTNFFSLYLEVTAELFGRHKERRQTSYWAKTVICAGRNLSCRLSGFSCPTDDGLARWWKLKWAYHQQTLEKRKFIEYRPRCWRNLFYISDLL